MSFVLCSLTKFPRFLTIPECLVHSCFSQALWVWTLEKRFLAFLSWFEVLEWNFPLQRIDWVSLPTLALSIPCYRCIYWFRLFSRFMYSAQSGCFLDYWISVRPTWNIFRWIGILQGDYGGLPLDSYSLNLPITFLKRMNAGCVKYITK